MWNCNLQTINLQFKYIEYICINMMWNQLD